MKERSEKALWFQMGEKVENTVETGAPSRDRMWEAQCNVGEAHSRQLTPMVLVTWGRGQGAQCQEILTLGHKGKERKMVNL